MRRFVSLAVLLFFTVPFGASIVGCGHKTITQYCNGGDSGPVVGQAKSITLSPSFATFGESLNYGQIGSSLSATAVDCKGSPVSVKAYTYATSNMTFADINPTTGQVCGGMFNRFSGGGVPDYTTCNAPAGFSTITSESLSSGVITLIAANIFNVGQQVTFAGLTAPTFLFLNGQTLTVASATATSFTVSFAAKDIASVADSGTATGGLSLTPLIAYVTASADGAVSNAIPVYIHPIASSIVIGNPTTSCSTDPDTSCCPITTGTVIPANPYLGTSCLSQGVTTQLTARIYKNGLTDPADNITCQAGHLQYAAQNSSILTIDENGVATAAQPGSTIVTASVSSSGSGGAAGFFATCPPASIALSLPGQTTNSATVNVNNNQPVTAVVTDTNGVVLTGVNLEFTSTSPSTIPAGAGAVIPTYPGSATITAICQPATCNPAPFSQIGLYGNGKPVTSNGIQITAPGNNASVLYIGSTQSQYLLPVDFSTGQQGTLVKLPYYPNSMVITQDGSTIYLGSSTALMTVSAINNQVSGSPNQSAVGTVLSVSPDGSLVVVTDPIRKTVSLVTSAGAISTSYGGVGISAQWAPDSQTVYIAATNNQLLVHSSYTGWYSTPTAHQYNDVAVTVPSVGAFFATSDPVTEARTYCSTSTVAAGGNPPAVANTYYPVANDVSAKTDQIAATDDENHIIGATASATPATLTDIRLNLTQAPNSVTGPLSCTTATSPVVFNTVVNTPIPLTGVVASAITGVEPAANSSLAFVTYTGSSGLLPEYIPAATGAGTLTFVTLSGGATTAPVSGVFSTDNATFYAGTSGDNQVHLITISGTTAKDSSVITPKLPDINGNPTVPNLLVQRVKKATS